ALSGAILWESSALEAVHLLGVSRNKLIVTTANSPAYPASQMVKGLRALDVAKGDAGPGWVQAGEGVPPSFGRGFLTEDLVFWPTRHGLRLVCADDGRPHPLQPVVGASDRPVWGNLALGRGCLVAATPTELRCYVAPERQPVAGPLGELSPP